MNRTATQAAKPSVLDPRALQAMRRQYWPGQNAVGKSFVGGGVPRPHTKGTDKALGWRTEAIKKRI